LEKKKRRREFCDSGNKKKENQIKLNKEKPKKLQRSFLFFLNS